ncbi:MYB transcription factor [Melia azedarach]|uniref:MYB transcription factor n=1 Tax=Melia azedarach TaxID=155640 RepID=A0ACC1YU54_MELAZ|nr:MYB transcription factor [Melia azedarach]
MDGKREEIRKGPWKAEEDEVLINHVKQYGPRDWSSIRSKGLLQRTGKSGRLRWVNKLRPNLKNGCKFSLEEERIVIELQAQFGNKWARIATYLPGRTDNDVKNFWSSRQKRLARILQNSATPSPSNSKSHKVVKEIFETSEDQKFKAIMEEESSSKAQLPDMVNPKLLHFGANYSDLQLTEDNPYTESQLQIHFPQIPYPQQDLTFSPESQELLATLEDPYFLDVFGPVDAPELSNEAQLPVEQPFFKPETSCMNGGKERSDKSVNSEALFEDFPTDMF